MHTARINGTLWPPPASKQSIGRQMPNEQADAIWKEWELTRVLPLTKHELVKLGKDPTTAVKLEDEIWGLGEDVYAGVLDVYHQLHCLNSLRHIAYGNYYNKTMADAGASSSMQAMHINHCVDILTQALQCSANVNIITLDWVETQEHPFPDMSVGPEVPKITLQPFFTVP